MLSLILVASSMASINCEDIIATLTEYREYTELSEKDVRRIAGRCADYLERTEDSEEEDK